MEMSLKLQKIDFHPFATLEAPFHATQNPPLAKRLHSAYFCTTSSYIVFPSRVYFFLRVLTWVLIINQM